MTATTNGIEVDTAAEGTSDGGAGVQSGGTGTAAVVADRGRTITTTTTAGGIAVRPSHRYPSRLFQLVSLTATSHLRTYR